LVATIFVCLLSITPLQAQPARVFVSATGADANPCTFAQPCRTFQHAHDTVAAGGEIDVLDPAGYGPVSINRAISIQAHGFAGITASGTDGITINAGPNDKISLRGLLLEGVASGLNGILFSAGGVLDIQDCVIRNFTGRGILFAPSGSAVLLI